MRTPATLHIQHCSEPGCLNDALITCASGDNATAVKGWCNDHMTNNSVIAKQRETELENEILRSLGFAA